jgi:hypothetical protein
VWDENFCRVRRLESARISVEPGGRSQIEMEMNRDERRRRWRTEREIETNGDGDGELRER